MTTKVGSSVLGASLTLVTPVLGTPTSGTLTNCTLPYSGLTGTVPTWNQNTSGTAAGLSATLAVGSGGTGNAGTLTGVIYGNGATAHSVASATQIVAAIGATAVTNATNAAGLSATLAVGSGGTGNAGTLTGVIYGNGATAHSVASATQIVAAIGATAVTNATNAAGLSATLAVGSGGTGVTTFTAANNALYSTSAGALTAGTLPVAAGGTGGTVGGVQPIQPITASVATSALTVTLNPTILNFRNTPLTSGTINTRTVATAISVVVPSTATLGTVSAQQSRLVLLALDNAGTVELAVVNIAGGTNLDETTLISTTAISAAATAANVIYSTTARTSLPFRVVGYIESTQATAGTWATAPTTIQGQGGQALAAMSSLGYGQTWQTVTRALGTTFYNTTGKPIQLNAYTASVSTAGSYTITVAGNVSSFQYAIQASFLGTALIPAGASYVLAFSGSLASQTITELR